MPQSSVNDYDNISPALLIRNNTGPENKFHDDRVVRDKDHIEEHLKEEFGFNSTEEMSEEEYGQ